MQQKDYCREEKFLSDEKHLLGALPENDFEVKYYKELKVAKNNHIRLTDDKHYYSAPYTYIGSKVKVIYTRSMVRIYANAEQIAVHKRSFKQGGYTTVKEHLCSHHQHYLDRSPGYYMEKARKKSEPLYQVMHRMFEQGQYPELLYRSCDGLLSLLAKTAEEELEQACTIALEHNYCNYGFIKNIIANKMTGPIEKTNNKPLPQHENVRGPASFK